MSNSDRVRQMVEIDKGRTLQSMADELGISRERVRQICREHGIQRERRDKAHYCEQCGWLVKQHGGGSYARLCRSCRDDARKVALVWFTCEQCGLPFHRTPTEVRAHERTGQKTRWCSRKCHGLYVGLTFGLGSPNETERQWQAHHKKEVTA